ncbi:ABC transporter permease [Lentilactobacillus sunkii]|uniref:Na+ ABC transporter permease n=1 Tax=Lentilactobacillus sunkii DSM 19904 TaxID=1423808 RepID=A0A0R1L5F8_9LACO|nr:ABC transporter permease [Lentilactobacillus sunkii]KRK87362.1 Na+ ABC transporter permease [Lentilactobacillus sunkii DSM 19904]
MNKTLIVAIETYLRQVKSWSFIMLVLSPFILLAISLGIGYTSATSSSDQQRIAVISEQPALRKEFIKANKDDVKASVTTNAAAQKSVDNNKLTGYLVLSADKNKVTGVYHSSDSIGTGMKTRVNVFLAQTQQQLNLANAKLSSKQMKSLAVQPAFKEKIKANHGGANLAKIISFWVLVFMIYMILITYSSVTAQEIASEKGTKVMEIIFSSTKASKYFVGKILGVFGVILTQIVVYIVGGYGFFQIAMHLDNIKSLIADNQSLVDGIIKNMLGINLLFVFLGVIIYTIISAFSGALVAKAEDAPKAAQPAIYLSMIAFFLTMPFQSNSDALIAKVLSYVPFFSSYFMPMRIINDNASGMEIGISLVILIASILLLTWYIGQIYEGLILQTDDTSFWKRLRRGLAYQK